MQRLRLAMFDVDGTIVDSQANIVSAMTQAWTHMGLGLPRPEDVRRIIGLSLLEAVAVLLPFSSHEVHRAVAESYKDAFRAMRLLPETTEPLFPGTLEAFDALERDGWLLGLATGKSRRGVDSMLCNHGLEDRFVTIQTADDNPGKPHPAMLLRAAAETGVDMDQVVMIGDTTFDMQMAAAAQSLAVGVSWGNHSQDELREAGARIILDNFDMLGTVLNDLTGRSACA